MLETRVIEQSARIRGLLAPSLLVAGVVLGGSSSGGAIANLALLGLALCVLLATIWLPRAGAATRAERVLLWIGAAFVVVGLLQLVPLPPAWWRGLPGRAVVAHGFELARVPLPWLPLSLDPLATVRSLLPAAIALAAFRAVQACDDRNLALLPWTFAACAAVSILLGVTQLTGGPESPLRFYAITNASQPVGFFANSNHLATLLVLSLPFLAALGRRRFGRMKPQERAPQIVALCALGFFLIAGAVMAGSVAGLGLLLPAVLGGVLILVGKERAPVAVGAIVAAFVAMGVLIYFASRSQLLDGFAATSFSSSQGGRSVIYATTVDAVRSFFPFGTGLGTFVDIYPWFENVTTVTGTYVNHAHSDYLELVLETGAAGIVLVLAFAIWWLRRAVQIWLGRDGTPLAKAATLASGIVMAHSLVDYPLRTATILIAFVISLALMARPAGAPTAASAARPKARHLAVH